METVIKGWDSRYFNGSSGSCPMINPVPVPQSRAQHCQGTFLPKAGLPALLHLPPQRTPLCNYPVTDKRQDKLLCRLSQDARVERRGLHILSLATPWAWLNNTRCRSFMMGLKNSLTCWMLCNKMRCPQQYMQ